MENNTFQKENLKDLRNFLNLTFEGLSGKTGISVSQLKSLESGKTKKPNSKTMDKLINFFEDTFNFASGIIFTKEVYKDFFFHEYKNRESCIKNLIEIKNEDELWKQDLEEHQVEMHDYDVIDETANKWFKAYYKRVNLKFPYPYTKNTVCETQQSDSDSHRRDPDTHMYYKYYDDKLKEEKQVLDALLSNLQKKYNMSDTEIHEIVRKFENVNDLEIFLIHKPDVFLTK